MPIHYALHRDGKPTGHTKTVASPHELTARTPQLTRKVQARQQRLIATLDRSAKWQRAAAPTPTPAAPTVDVEALVEQRIAEERAKWEKTQTAAEMRTSPRGRRKATATNPTSAPRTDETPGV